MAATKRIKTNVEFLLVKAELTCFTMIEWRVVTFHRRGFLVKYTAFQ